MLKIEHYQDEDGGNPFRAWFGKLRDIVAKTAVLKRIDRVTLGNFGNCRDVGSGITELKIDIGPGYRIYLAHRGERLVILLCGGNKSTQSKDIELAEILARLKKETGMKKKASVSHDEWMIEELRADPKLAAEYLRQAMTDMSDPEGRGAALLALRRLAEAHGGMAAVATEAGIQRESLYRALSPKGNPTMNTLIAVLKSLGMRLTVEPDKKAA